MYDVPCDAATCVATGNEAADDEVTVVVCFCALRCCHLFRRRELVMSL
jgi:hypothetical protein